MAQIPDMFHAQKECCFRAMEQDAFPRFLRSKAFGNLKPALVGLVVGFGLGWRSDSRSRNRNAFSDLYHSQSRSLPHFSLHNTNWIWAILVFLGQSETTPFRTLRRTSKSYY
jgi:hypothetical protein